MKSRLVEGGCLVEFCDCDFLVSTRQNVASFVVMGEYIQRSNVLKPSARTCSYECQRACFEYYRKQLTEQQSHTESRRLD